LDTLANLWKIGAMMFVVGGTMGENWKKLSIDNDERCELPLVHSESLDYIP
jgi:hypothetical protein